MNLGPKDCFCNPVAKRSERQGYVWRGWKSLEQTVFAAYNHFAGPKDIKIYRYNDHEGGGTHHTVKKVKFLTKLWR